MKSVLFIFVVLSLNSFGQDVTKYNAICSSIATFKDDELKSSTSYNKPREIIYSKELEYIKISYPENNSSDFFILGEIFDTDMVNYLKIYQKAHLKNSSNEEAFIFYWKNGKLIKIQRCLTDLGTLFVTTFDITQ
jgi:hypothetical protein